MDTILIELFVGAAAGVFLLLCAAINALWIRIRSRGFVEQNPALEGGYRKLFWGYLVVQCWPLLPMLVLMIGRMTGGLPSMRFALFPHLGNPYVLVAWGMVMVSWVLWTIWIYFLGGAEFIVDYLYALQPGPKIRSPLTFKIVYGLAMLMMVVGLLAVWVVFFARGGRPICSFPIYQLTIR